MIDALERLVDRESWSRVTPGAIATEAGVGHGTSYRYFKDRQALFAVAVALSLIMQMITRRSVIEQELLSEDDHAAVIETFDRIIFWRRPDQM